MIPRMGFGRWRGLMGRMAVFVALALVLVLSGCMGSPGEGRAADGGASGAEGGQDAYPAADAGDGGGTADAEGQETVPAGAETAGPGGESRPSGKTDVLMLGRSVAYGWAEYMGLEWQEDESYAGEYGGRTFRYLHMDYPPDIDDSAIRAMETYDYDVVFFKLCFVDFGTEYGDMLADDEQYVENVYEEAVVRRGKKLIVGNALPQVSRDTTPGMRQNHQEYNRWLNEFASTHEGVYVLDIYGTLADGSGNLKSSYAASYDDSHPNSAGYAALTPRFMDVVDEAMGD